MSIIEKGNDWARKNPLKFLVIGIVIIGLSIKVGSNIGSTLRNYGGGTPSICDCDKVMMYKDGAVDAAKRILGNSYGADFMKMSQNECALKYWDEIKKWGERKGLSGTPTDNAMEFFMEKCK